LNQDYKSNVHKNGLPKNQKELKANTDFSIKVLDMLADYLYILLGE
jgi:hypothetical protein